MYPVECVARGYLTGSGLLDYRATGPDHMVCGVPLPRGARGRQPAARADLHPGHEGRDRRARRERVLRRGAWPPSVRTRAAQLRDLTLAVYSRAEGIARERGIILADTKLELGARGDGTMVLADEVLTPGLLALLAGRRVAARAARRRRTTSSSCATGCSPRSRAGTRRPTSRRRSSLQRWSPGTRRAVRRGLRAAHRPDLTDAGVAARRARVGFAVAADVAFDYLADPHRQAGVAVEPAPVSRT